MMKKILIILIALTLFLSGCSSATALTEQETTEIEYTEATISPDEALGALHVSGAEVSPPNSAGGVDWTVYLTNESDKTIKYITFTVQPFNAVDDPVMCEISGMSEKYMRATGPIYPVAEDPVNNGCSFTWENEWYNSNISYATMLEINIEYMDGSSIEIPKGIIERVNYQ